MEPLAGIIDGACREVVKEVGGSMEGGIMRRAREAGFVLVLVVLGAVGVFLGRLHVSIAARAP